MGSVLFGRNSELETMGDALAAMLNGRGTTLLLAGEPGIGKSRLADELANEALEKGAAVHWGRGWEGGGAPAYWPWTEALSSLTAGLDTKHLAALVGDDAPEIARLIPQLRIRFGDLEAASLPEANEGRFRLAAAVTATLRRASAVKPLVILLDDLHTADLSTLGCLQLVARSARSMRLLLVGTYREAEARLTPVLTEALGLLSREATTLHLAALDRAPALALIEERAHLSGELAAKIADAAGGNPLFLGEMSRLVVARGADHLPGSELPLGVMESIRQRLALLPPAAIEVLELAACAGRQIDPVLLAAALGEKLSAVMGPLDRAGQAGMIVERGTGRIAFSHDLLREVLRRGIPRDKRLGLHQKLAAALASGNGSGLASAIAHQRLEAAELEPDEAVRAAITAANEALELVAYEEALELLDRAKQVVKGGAVAPALSAQLDVALGEARLRAGDLPGAKQACSDAVAAARALGDFELLANAALVWGSEIQQGVIDPDLVAWLTEANTALAANVGVLKARVLARLAAALQPSGRPLEPIQMARDAIALAREAGDDRALLEVLHSAMAAMMDYAHPAERMPLNLEQEALGQRFHDRPRELRARLRLFFDYLTLGDMGLAESRATSFDALARQLKQSRFEWFLPSWRAMRATYEGRWDDARAQIAAARGVAPPGQLSEVRDVMQQMALARARENRAEIAQCEALMLREWRLIEMGSVLSRIIFSANQVRLGDAAAGIRTLEELAASNIPISGGFITGFDGLMRADPVFLSMMADALALIDHPARKSGYALVQQVRGLQHQFGLVGMAWEGPFARPLALLARSLGHVDTAIDFFEEACADLERHSGRGHLARAWLETAEARLQRGAAGDVERAHALIAQARALATELQQSALLEVFSTRLGGAMTKAAPAARATPSQPPAGPAFSLRREGDTWEVKGEGAPFRLKDSRGLQLLARLAERPDQEVHCLELASDGPVKDIDASDAGDWLDPKAKREYRDRLEDLRESLREAEEFGDTARADLARLELEFIGAELSRGLGLGGRSRKAGSTAERARVAVQRRIKDAVGRIAEHDATLGRHLEWAVKTGTYCCYRPTR